MNAVLSCLLNIILLPFYLLAFVLFLVIWGVFTLTGIGPCLQYCYSSSDGKLLDRNTIAARHTDIRILTIPANVNTASGHHNYQLCARYTVPPNFDPSKPPIALPNGLGATLVLTSVWHEELARRGYRVLSFDRLGVGFTGWSDIVSSVAMLCE
jgi:hypothetical protein